MKRSFKKNVIRADMEDSKLVTDSRSAIHILMSISILIMKLNLPASDSQSSRFTSHIMISATTNSRPEACLIQIRIFAPETSSTPLLLLDPSSKSKSKSNV